MMSSSSKESRADASLATAEEGKQRGYESKEYIMKSLEFETKSEAACEVDDAHELRIA